MQSYQHHNTNLGYHGNGGYEPALWQHSVDPAHNGFYNTSQNGEMFIQSCDFAPLSGDIFQPEEIFQLDQPLRPSEQTSSDATRSPTIILDLGNGSRDAVKSESQSWMCQSQSSVGTDDSSSSCGRFGNYSPDNNNLVVFQQNSTCGSFNKVQDCQADYTHMLKSEVSFDEKEASFLFSCDIESEKMKNNGNILGADLDPRYLCFSSEDSSIDQDCVSNNARYHLTEDVRHNGALQKNYGKNFADYGIFPEMIQNPAESFVDCQQTLNKMCASLENSFPQKSIQEPLYFMDHSEVRMSCDSDGLSGYLQQTPIINNNTHFPHVSN